MIWVMVDLYYVFLFGVKVMFVFYGLFVYGVCGWMVLVDFCLELGSLDDVKKFVKVNKGFENLVCVLIFWVKYFE